MPRKASTQKDDAKRQERRARMILSENVRKLIEDARESRPQLGAIKKVAEYHKDVTHGRSTLSKSRVGRIAKGDHPTDIDAIGDLADAFGLQPWQLLVEHLNPKALPQLADADLLERIQRVVSVAQTANAAISPSPTVEQPLQRSERSLGPALQGAIKNAGGGDSAAQKRQGRRSGKGATGTR